MTSMVLDTSVTYADLETAVTDLGWQRQAIAMQPLVSGEPEFATFAKPDAGTLVYTCNPAVWLRVLDLDHVAPSALVALALRLPHLGEEAITGLLRAKQTERVLRGVLAAGVLPSPRHLQAVRALLHHRDPSVARAAIATSRVLVQSPAHR
jgi:hypothetical protein